MITALCNFCEAPVDMSDIVSQVLTDDVQLRRPSGRLRGPAVLVAIHFGTDTGIPETHVCRVCRREIIQKAMDNILQEGAQPTMEIAGV
jgi:hypothetical protein